MVQELSLSGTGLPDALAFTAENAGNVRMLNIDPWNGESARPPEYAVESCWAAAEYQGLVTSACGLALTVYSWPPAMPCESKPV
jgi:hypothetical protein